MLDYIFINRHGHELATDGVARRGQTFETETQARAHAEHLAIENRTAVTVAEVVAYRVQPTCQLCEKPRPATTIAGDWVLCDDHYNAISEPWPGVDDDEATMELGESSY